MELAAPASISTYGQITGRGLDASFGAGGKLTDFERAGDIARSVVVQADGKLGCRRDSQCS